jgi:LuxR family transcriptional regulator, maltose regulon positive regulatory protein
MIETDNTKGEHVSRPGTGVASGENDQIMPEQSKRLLRTKFFVPPVRSNQVSRSRLIDLLNGGMDKTLILISAPAGYGKTTLVSRWLKETGIPFAWLSLDARDNDPACFLQYLLAAIQSISPGIGNGLLDMLQGAQAPQYENVINLLTNELAASSDSFVLVMDDFHLIQSEAVLNIIYYLLEHLPDRKPLFLLTRIDPALPLSRLRVRNQLLDIRADQLRFTHDEIAAFLNDVMGLTLSANDLSAMETRTEGWIAGLQLAALSMQSCNDIHGFVSAFTGSHRYIVDYLVEEVLRLQPRKVGAFLLWTSILDQMCGPLCEALMNEGLSGEALTGGVIIGANAEGPIDGQATLEALEKMNLFVVPLDNDRRWYRYHHLFADVLRKRLEQQYPQLRPELHRRASHWYEQNGLTFEAIQQAIVANDKERAAKLIEGNGCFLLMSGGEVATLLNWTEAIEFQAEIHPWLAILKGWALALTGNLDRVEPALRDPEQLLTPLEPTDEVRTLRGTIAAARAHCANSRGDTKSAAKYAQQALEKLPVCTSICSIRSAATLILGDASWINGELDKATHAYAEAIRIGREGGNLPMVIITNSNLAEVLMEQGQLSRAADIYTQSLQMAVRPDGQRSPLAGSVYAGLGRLSYEYNRLDDASQNIHRCIELCRQWGDFNLLAVACSMLARLEQVKDNPEEAQKAMRSAEQLADNHSLSPLQSILVNSNLALLWLAQRNLEKLSKFIQKSGLTIEDEIPYQRGPEYVILLRLLLAQGDYDASLTLSQRLLQKAESSQRMRLAVEVLVLQALIFQGRKDLDQALAVLKKALSLAKPERYIRTFVDEGEPMVRLLHIARSRQIETEYCSELLSGIEVAAVHALGIPQPRPQLLIEPLTTREIEVLKLIQAGCSNQEIAEKLVISFTTVKRHISNIYTKLDAKSRTQAIAIGKELKLFE